MAIQAAPLTAKPAADTINLKERRQKFTGLFRYLLFDYARERVLKQVLGAKRMARTAEARNRRRAIKFRETAIELGGVLIKLGQYLSARYDILSKEWIEELSKLQDNVPPVDFAAVRDVIEQEFGRPLDEIYGSFDPQPLASASLGQVHRATLPDGTPVAVKVLRPRIRLIVDADLESLTKIITFLSKRTDLGKLSDLPGIAREFNTVLRRELDYTQELANLERIKANLGELKYIYIPQVYKEYSNARVLTMEYVQGVKVTDRAAVERAGFSRDRIARILVNAYLNMFLLDGFFHADPHPGNLLVRPMPGATIKPAIAATAPMPVQVVNQTGAAADGSATAEIDATVAALATRARVSVGSEAESTSVQVVLLDFGMVGEINTAQRTAIRRIIIGCVARDAQAVTQALDDLHFIRKPEDFDKVRVAVSYFIDRFVGRSMSDLQNKDMQGIFDELGYIIYSNPLYLPADFAFLSRAAETLIGVVTDLSPALDLIKQAKPFVGQLVTAEAQSDGDGAVDAPTNNQLVVDQLRSAAINLIGVPARLSATLDKLDRGEIAFKLDSRELDEVKRQIAQTNRNMAVSMVASAVAVAGALIYRRQSDKRKAGS